MATDVHMSCFSTVLSLRGSRTVSQPCRESDNGPMLCWNGEAWSIDGQATNGNDTQQVFRLLLEATEGNRGDNHPRDVLARGAACVAKCMSTIAGPYAFVFYDQHGCIYFGRDFLGRRSLMTRKTEDGALIIASVSDGASGLGWAELEADGVYAIDLKGVPLTPKGPNADAYGSFSQQHTPYHFVGDGDDSNASVGPPRYT